MTLISPHKDFLQASLKKPVVLVGLMGAGKTTIGKLMSDALGLDFIDSDRVLEEREGRTIPEIFNQDGEAYFRTIEKENIIRILEFDIPCVLATGGGAFMNEEKSTVILTASMTVFLKADLDELVKRIGTGRGRPLFDGKNPREVLADLIKARYPTYEAATMTVEIGDESPQESAQKVINSLYNHLSPA